MSKIMHQPGVYRDDPDRDDAASTSSAVLLGDIEYPDEELPAYSDEPNAVDTPSARGELAAPSNNLFIHWQLHPPELPFSTRDMDSTEIRTRFPDYSTNAKTLYDMIHEQAGYPPSYSVELHGTHTETTRNGNKETKNKVTDFLIRIDLTHLVRRSIRSRDETIELLPENKRGYRGTRLPSFNPVVDTLNQAEELMAWCESYVSNPAGVKSFTLKREIVNHDTKKLDQLLRAAIGATQYRGHVGITFPLKYKRVVVYSPGKINEWRITTWIRWVFYLTFLWIFAWPALFFLTRKYEVVKAVYKYANVPTGDSGARRCLVADENEWYSWWAPAIQKAALSRMICKERYLDNNYRVAAMEFNVRDGVQRLAPRQSTGNAISDSALTFLSGGMSIANEWRASRGWGADS